MPLPKPRLSVRLRVLVTLVVFAVAALILLARYGLHRLAERRRTRG
jgi:hypothetical protein